ncbi:MAG: hypothetical protein ACLTQI_09130 [Slackia sp.]
MQEQTPSWRPSKLDLPDLNPLRGEEADALEKAIEDGGWSAWSSTCLPRKSRAFASLVGTDKDVLVFEGDEACVLPAARAKVVLAIDAKKALSMCIPPITPRMFVELSDVAKARSST